LVPELKMSSTWYRPVSSCDPASWQPPEPGDGRTRALLTDLTTLTESHSTTESTGSLGMLGVRAFVPFPGVAADAGERGIAADQTHRSVVVGESVVVKWLTPPAPLPQPTPDVFAHLTAVGFDATALPYAAVSWRRTGGPELLVALVTAFLPEARDGWEWCVDEAVEGRTAFAADAGRLAAEFHNAMAAPSEVFPDPVRRAAPGPSWLARAEKALNEAVSLTDGADGAWMAAHTEMLREGLSAFQEAGDTTLIRIHGDLHVGQILRWRDGYAIIDFDGNPTVPAGDPFQPAARDLAQLGTSIEHVGQVAIRRRDAAPARIAGWAAEARRLLLSAYAERLDPGLLDRSLLRAFEIEQECRELIYAARHLPRWRYAPMGVLRTWFA
jgi:maltokinase